MKTTIERVLCPVDFSECSRQAFDRATAVARACGAALTALNVIPVQTAAGILPYAGPESLAPFPLPEVQPERVKEALQSFLTRGAIPPIAVTYDVTEAPDVHREILAHAARRRADVIVVGTHGRSGVHRLILGSIAEKVLRRAPVPVLTVPPAAADAVATGAEPFRRVLCALDFSACSLLGLQFATAFAAEHHARLAVLHVAEVAPVGYDPFIGPPTDLARLKSAAEIVMRDRLHEAIPSVDRSALYIEEIVVAGTPHREIVRIAREWCADLIVLGIHGRSGLGRAAFGSTVEPVVRHAACPVLTMRTDAQACVAAA